ncbi:MAG: hypothetical protein JXB10_04435 [Pirellulales bacterium]|nr:hypothetical protein [Pirellulales bacterium]
MEFTPKMAFWVEMLLPIVHLLGFFGLTLLATASQWSLPWWGLGVALGIYALATELLQGLTVTRRPEWMDFFQDCGGIVLGLGVSWLFISVWRSFRKTTSAVNAQEFT